MQKFKTRGLIIFCLLAIFGSFLTTCKGQDTINFEFKDSYAINDSLVVHELVKLGVKEPFIVLAQAKLETGNYTSRYYYERWNLFGFRNKQGYMHFNSWRGCCQYYKTWQQKYYKGGDYYDFLVEIKYAEDCTYINKLKKM